MKPEKLVLSNKSQFAIALLLSVPIVLSGALASSSARESEMGFEFEGFQELNWATVFERVLSLWLEPLVDLADLCCSLRILRSISE